MVVSFQRLRSGTCYRCKLPDLAETDYLRRPFEILAVARKLIAVNFRN